MGSKRRRTFQPAGAATRFRRARPQSAPGGYRQLSEKLAEVFRLWGYSGFSPRVERLDTLRAGGAIPSTDIDTLVADEPLGLRPEADRIDRRAASTDDGSTATPLRLWASGTVFQSRSAGEGGQCIEENLQTGVELFGVEPIEAEMELLSLLMASVQALGVDRAGTLNLLVGHTGLMDMLLSLVEEDKERAHGLIQFDRWHSAAWACQRTSASLLSLLSCRGTPQQVLSDLRPIFGATALFDDLDRLCNQLEPMAVEQGILIQLDPRSNPISGLTPVWSAAGLR